MSDTLPIAFTADERKMLHAAEETIRLGLRTFLDVGEALAKIRDQRLYRAYHDTFEDYCQAKWDFSARRSRQLIGASDVVAALPMGTIVPTNEAQARVLVGLTPTEAAAVMEKADEETGGKLTATAIREVRNDWKRGQAASEDAISAVDRPVVTPDGKAYVRNGVPTSTGMQAISNAVPDVQRKPPRRPLIKQYHSAVIELQKAVDRLEKLHGDDRFPAQQPELACLGGALSEVALRVNNIGRHLVGTDDVLGIENKRGRAKYLGGEDE